MSSGAVTPTRARKVLRKASALVGAAFVRRQPDELTYHTPRLVSVDDACEGACALRRSGRIPG
jgi:hypothetical protein